MTVLKDAADILNAAANLLPGAWTAEKRTLAHEYARALDHLYGDVVVEKELVPHKDKRGRNFCIETTTGKRAACGDKAASAPKVGAAKKEPAQKKPAAAKKEPKPKAPAKPKAPPKPKAVKLSTDDALAAVKAGGDSGELAKKLTALTVPQLKELHAKLGLDKKGLKADLVKKAVDKAMEKQAKSSLEDVSPTLDKIREWTEGTLKNIANAGKKPNQKFFTSVGERLKKFEALAKTADSGQENGKEISPFRKAFIAKALKGEAEAFLAEIQGKQGKYGGLKDETLTPEQAKKAADLKAKTRAGNKPGTKKTNDKPSTVNKKLFGKSDAEVIYRGDKGQTDKQIENVSGGQWKAKDVSSLVGAPEGAEVLLSVKGESIRIRMEHDDFTAVRTIGIDENGSRFIKNDSFFVDQGQGKGTGMDVFGRQVENAISIGGFDYIECHAAGGGGHASLNGYYTWPRFGYNQDVEKFNTSKPDSNKIPQSETYKKIKEKFPEAKSVLDIMSTQEGRDWWKENGTDMYDAKFDLKEGSRSRQVFDAYVAERAAKGKK